MADKIVLQTPNFKGEFDFDIEEQPLTNLEWRWIKKVSGYLPVTLSEGFAGRDPDLFSAFAVIALVRAGKVDRADALSVAESFDDLAFGETIRLVAGEEADDAGEETPAGAPATEPPLRSIGGSSPTTSDHQEPPLEATGVPA